MAADWQFQRRLENKSMSLLTLKKYDESLFCCQKILIFVT
jgi:hypothetical protein